MTEKKEVATKPDTDASALLRLALEKDIDLERLEKLIDLKNREEERAAKQEYDLHFAEMQQDLGTAIRSKAATDRNGKTMYSYAPLEAILKVAAPVLAMHRFSYRWSEEALPNGEKRVWCIISGYGHSERNYVDIPIAEASAMTNAVQQRGVASTYGKRYSFIGATGIVIDDDTDAAGITSVDLAKYQERIEAIQGAEDMDTLKTAFSTAYKALEGDAAGRKLMIDAKDARKKVLLQKPADPAPSGKGVVIGKIEKMAAEATDAEVVDPEPEQLEIF